MNLAAKLRKADIWLIVCYLVLVIIGWTNIYASIHSDLGGSMFDFGSRAGKQFIWIMVSFSVGAAILIINSKIYEVLSFWAYVATAILLFVTIFIGADIKGSHSWLQLGPVSFQPAELSKITTSLLLASVMSQFGFRLNSSKGILRTALIILIPMLLIIAEKETGSALVYVGFIFMLYREGLPGWILVLGGLFITLFITTLTTSPFVSLLILLGFLAMTYGAFTGRTLRVSLIAAASIALLSFLPGLMRLDVFSGMDLPRPEFILLGLSLAGTAVTGYFAFRKRNSLLAILAGAFIAGAMLVFSVDFIFDNVLQDHQRKRIEVLLGMEEDPTGVGYNVTQSMIAIGSGGLTGKGFLKGTQTAYGFVPEQSTDFIFCTVGEEWGFMGSAVVIALYVLLICRIIMRAEKSAEAFTRIYGYCIACCLFMHFFINIGMTIGLMPVIGIPLPFLSYGGSSLLCFTIMLFIFIALDMRQKR
ncbi:MAG: rod shape-determining protein RodA [Bacteroidetes bacterium]|uniref:Cell wall polymerase n=1 Tax=Candidatus Merdivivens pullistercoris TaxID=2840873 RepID=A0A9D9I4J5_9BACT|nr:rod shape-determining protein RodA [Candidatus Merdivivens pullistercoris]